MSSSSKESQLLSFARMRDVVFLSLGVALVVLSAFFDARGHSILYAISLNLGLVSVAVVLVDHIWRICGGRPINREVAKLSGQIERLAETIDTIEDRENIGLVNAHISLANFGIQDDWISLLKSAKKNVDLMGRTLFGWSNAKNLKEILHYRIQRDKVTFRWLLMSKDNAFLTNLEAVEPHSRLSSKIDSMHTILKECKECNEGQPELLNKHLQVKCFPHVPLTCGILRIDETIYVTQYLFNTISKNSPFYVVIGPDSAWYSAYLDEFETIWKKSKPLNLE